jgi:hypothetical protein
LKVGESEMQASGRTAASSTLQIDRRKLGAAQNRLENGDFACCSGTFGFPATFPRPALHGKTSLHFIRDKQLVNLAGKEATIGGETAVAFELPAAPYTQIE